MGTPGLSAYLPGLPFPSPRTPLLPRVPWLGASQYARLTLREYPDLSSEIAESRAEAQVYHPDHRCVLLAGRTRAIIDHGAHETLNRMTANVTAAAVK